MTYSPVLAQLSYHTLRIDGPFLIEVTLGERNDCSASICSAALCCSLCVCAYTVAVPCRSISSSASDMTTSPVDKSVAGLHRWLCGEQILISPLLPNPELPPINPAFYDAEVYCQCFAPPLIICQRGVNSA